MRNNKRQSGIVALIYIFIMAMIITLIMIIGESRLLLSLQRGRSSTDTILTTYQAEYEINNQLLRLISGKLTSDDFRQFPNTKSLYNGNFIVTINGRISGTDQILEVTAKKQFAVNKIQAVRSVQEAQEVKPIDLVLMIDCTHSMREPSGAASGTTRMQEAKKAALSFVNQIRSHPNGDFIRMGLGVFGTDAAWVKTSDGRDITPTNGVSLNDVYNSISTKFNSTREDSTACAAVRDYTSIGSGYTFVQDYFDASTSKNKRVEVLITDGEPNTRIEYPKCPVSRFCQGCLKEAQDFLRCALTENTKRWDLFNFGVRNPNITAYGITILSPRAPLVEDIFNNTIGTANYYNATTADQLSGILDSIFDKVISSLSTINISRIIPLEQ
jgi:hypothetical protein